MPNTTLSIQSNVFLMYPSYMPNERQLITNLAIFNGKYYADYIWLNLFATSH
jgi:hypothetical protein